MEDNDFANPCVLALLVPLKNRIGLIALSERFEFSLTPLSKARSPTENVVLRISRSDSGSLPAHRSSVESLTVLYGENGWGKTQLMLEACKSLSNIKGERRVAMLWESRGCFYLDPGSILKRTITTEFPGEEIAIRGIEDPFGAVFYTTSPFETNRRRIVKSEAFFDATPSFSPANPFEGGALLRAFAKLPANFPFIETAEARMRVRIPSLRSVLEKLMPSFKRQFSNFPQLQDRHRRTLARLDQLLYERAEEALVVGLLIALQGGVDRAAEVLLELANKIRLFDDLNGSGLMDDEVKEHTTEAVIHFLAEPSNFYGPYDHNTLSLYHFLDIELTSYVKGLGPRTTLGTLARAFDGFTESQWEMLDQAARLGLISWSFRKLSSGQVALLMLFSSLSNAMSRLPTKKTAFLFIDEGEMFMHPAWQRRYITDLLEFLKKFPEVSSHLHVILSTHSLIVAADAPPNRLFDVKTGEMTNGFGYGPKDLLDHIYRVDEFQGEHAGRLMESLIDHLRSRVASGLHPAEAFALASSIADDRLRNYLINELARRGEEGGCRFD